ncbi:MAG: Asp-tRNA(Asn)/Glu-tRNA(Gln) amidotransferase subunit GatA [Rhodothermaceae bacterium]|nr:Asp-tRNA(Asn)/Glu-tRNA(Gln) amidotransferase subunit GatA [Rhodothermaceae bacterium]MXZ57700.1 Asp-tRNA(Asn)/Glu-tRNA(Gln) amidotransferase subunit GatA [Rhodothermaceae bacterium]MYB91358.1 Asp-tRNA(Asn)/Glu-tRNA(Gln) amidotransferase subunit GatA [Rhodothermaceae bacterium]MYD68799.1 Asp-tRNA(Asn)/Glu-tRNA(Gln) amidotransferase subunit GatA [Rhodothermaceae bacterium]MYG45453.1 Asp-tRNA(Asn)/Glu-tRNA(Gln) amidotransferase subunit GatA [Rhodothermaceae bacterium]
MALPSFADCRSALLEKRTSCAEIAQLALDTIQAKNPLLNAFTHVDAETVHQSAETIDRAFAQRESLPLMGLVLGVKDVLSTTEWPVTCSSKILEGYHPPFEATSVARLRSAGALLIGRTNCDEFAMGATTEYSAYGPTLNPHNLEYVSGGSSGGSAAAVAAGMCHAALGTDTGGSVRQPAAFCGVLGLKPTYGLVSRYGLVAFASSFDCVGTFADTAEVASKILSHMAGSDPSDATCMGQSYSDVNFSEEQSIRGLRIGLPKEYYGEGLDPEVRKLVDQTASTLESEGANLVPVSLPHTEYGVAAYYILTAAEASSNLSRYDGVKYGLRYSDEGHSLEDMYTGTRSSGFGFEVKRRVMLGTYVLSAGYYDAYYGKAQRVRNLIRKDFDEAWQKVDVLLTPVNPAAGMRVGQRDKDPLQLYLSDAYTVTANLAGIPGISIPVGSTTKGLPVGVQLLGAPFSESTLLSTGKAIMDLR